MPGFRADVTRDVDLLACLAKLDRTEITTRLEAGHRPYVGYLDGSPAAYGWVAAIAASIGELALEFDLNDQDRYLWDFATLPEWRGRGIYPHLLQAILRHEADHARRCWIIYAPENAASARGIAKAGFTAVSKLSFLASPGIGSVVRSTPDRARVGAGLLGVPLYEAVQAGQVISPCWRCVLEKHGDGACWPPGEGVAHTCTCVIAPQSHCAEGEPAVPDHRYV